MNAALLEQPIADSPADICPVEWSLRVDLAAAFRLAALFKWDDLIFTHMSVRIPGPDHHFLINSYQQMFEEVTASSLLRIDLEGLPVRPSPHEANPAGFTIHSAIHMGREDAAAVIHLHTPHGQAVSAMDRGLMPLTQTAMAILHEVTYHEFEGIAVDLGERERLVADLGTKNAMILRNHGTLATGACIADAFARIYFLERACEAQVMALSTGLDGLRYPTDAALQKINEQTAARPLSRLARGKIWPALLRKLERVDPSYKN